MHQIIRLSVRWALSWTSLLIYQVNLQPMIRTARRDEVSSDDKRVKEYWLVPSGPPAPYNISIGWKAREVERGMNGEGFPRGNALIPVGALELDRGMARAMDRIVVRWSRQWVGVSADVLELEIFIRSGSRMIGTLLTQRKHPFAGGRRMLTIQWRTHAKIGRLCQLLEDQIVSLLHPDWGFSD